MAENTLATAYIQIVPSAKGIKGSITKELEGESSDAGKKAGQGLASNMVGVIKRTLLAAGVGSAFTATLMAGADYEQAVGGIETLFSESADIVKDYADEAYSTAGLSANDYMTNVTRFAAALLRGLEGDTARAAEIANMAIIDAADNANKFGTDLETVLGVYQSLAKGNYMTLDNLNLGYAGTKAGLEDLIEAASEFSGIEYDSDNLADVYLAIHDIQVMLGITGTTADEAAGTFTGSLNQMKAAFENLATAIGANQDAAGKWKETLETVETFADGNLIPALGRIKNSIGDIFPPAEDLFGFVEENGSEIGTVASTLVGAFAGAKIPGVIEGLKGSIAKLFVSFSSFSAPGIILAAIGAIAGATIYLWNTNEDFRDAVGPIWEDIKDAFSDASDSIATYLTEDIPESFDTLLDFLNFKVDKIKGLIDEIPAAMEKLGMYSEEGFWEGLGKGFTDSRSIADIYAERQGKSFIQGIKDFFGINSPSKLMRDEIGRYIPAGIAVGIEGNLQPVTDAMDKLAGATVATNVADTITANVRTQSLQRPTPVQKDTALYDLINRYLPAIAEGGNVNVTLEGDVNKLFTAIRKEAASFSYRTGRSAF